MKTCMQFVLIKSFLSEKNYGGGERAPDHSKRLAVELGRLEKNLDASLHLTIVAQSLT